MSTNFSYIGIDRSNRLSIHFIVFCCCILLSNWNSEAYTQQFNWSWASQIHGTHVDAINDVCTNAKGEILINGSFYSTAIQWEGNTLVNPYENSFNGLYLGKLNRQGTLLWNNQIFCAPGNYHSSVYFRDAELNAFGDSFIAGHVYRNGIAIDTVIFPTSEDYSSSGFITRFDQNGNILWGHVFEDGCEVSSVVADADGGFYIMGNMYWYCGKINFGDTIIHNNLSENQAYIAHYNNDNTIDWAKLVQGYINEIKGQLTDKQALLITGNYQINGYLDTLTIDDFTITCPLSTYHCSFWGQLNQEGEVEWLKNIAQDNISVSGFYKVSDGYKQFISFNNPFIIIQGDTIYDNNADYYSNHLLTFDLNGNFRYANDLPISIGGEYYSLYNSPTDNWYVSLLLDESLTCNGELIANAALRGDPVIMQVDTEFYGLECYQQELNYLAYAPRISWDRFGNMLMVGSFSGDTLVFTEDVLTNYQLQSQTDYYLAYGLNCDTNLYTLNIQDNILQAPDGISWAWYFNDTLIQQNTTQVISQLHEGYYIAAAVQPDGCVKWTEPYWYFSGVESNSIFIYPNPSKGNCTVILPEVLNYLNVYDITGNLIYSCIPTQKTTLELSYLPSGSYYLKAGNANQIYTTKFIIL